MHYNFEKDLRDSNESTPDLIKLLTERGFTELKTNDDKRYDIIGKDPKGKEVTIEYKDDIGASQIKNVAIEFKSRGKDSGIMTTKAKYWVHKVDGVFWYIKTRDLFLHLINNEYRVVEGGDNNTSSLVLMPKVEFYKIAKSL